MRRCVPDPNPGGPEAAPSQRRPDRTVIFVCDVQSMLSGPTWGQGEREPKFTRQIAGFALAACPLHPLPHCTPRNPQNIEWAFCRSGRTSPEMHYAVRWNTGREPHGAGIAVAWPQAAR